jgi:2-haloacid dehalogenase
MGATRRQLLALSATAIAGAAAIDSGIGAESGKARIKAVAFDALTIFDLRSVTAEVEAFFLGRGNELTAAWRTRQFEYCWLRTLNRRYADFWQVTEEALIFTFKAAKIDLPAKTRAELMNAFLQVKPWPDVIPALQAMRGAGLRLAYLSNFTSAMMKVNTEHAGMSGLFERYLSTDEVQAFKPDPRAYEMAERAFGVEREAILFAAFAGWDVAGAKSFGLRTFWVNRADAVLEELGVGPDAAGRTLTDLAAYVTSI